MLLDLNNADDVKKFDSYTKHLREKRAKVELKEKKGKRTVRQNAYLHAILCLFAGEHGYTLRETKETIFKKYVNPEIFEYEFIDKLTGECTNEYRSSASLTTDEMMTAITRFRNYSAENGFYLLSSDEFIEQRFYIEKEIQRLKEFL